MWSRDGEVDMTKIYCDYCGEEVEIECVGREITENGWDVPIIRPIGTLKIYYGGRTETVAKDLCGKCLEKAIKLLETEK